MDKVFLLLLMISTLSLAWSLPQHCSCQWRNESRNKCEDQRSDYYDHKIMGLSGDCLPSVEINSVACFRTKITECSQSGPQCTLLPRSNDPTLLSLAGNQRYMTSPGFNMSKYRNRDFCIYNINMSDVCEEKKLYISAIRTNTHGMEMSDYGCIDYLLFDYGEMSTNKLCGIDLSTYSQIINSSSFLAYFWTDDNVNNGSFQFSVSCMKFNTSNCSLEEPVQTIKEQCFSPDLDNSQEPSTVIIQSSQSLFSQPTDPINTDTIAISIGIAVPVVLLLVGGSVFAISIYWWQYKRHKEILVMDNVTAAGYMDGNNSTYGYSEELLVATLAVFAIIMIIITIISVGLCLRLSHKKQSTQNTLYESLDGINNAPGLPLE